MVTIEEALSILQDTIRNNRKHPDYDYVVDLAAWYHKIITGKDVDELLRRFVRREDETMFAQRKRLTIAITPAVSETLINPFYRVGRLDNVRKQITYPEGQAGADKRVEELNEYIASFWGNDSLDKYLATRFIQLGATDPNAWLAVDFAAFDANREKAKPFPVEYSSEEAINFSIVNNQTEWLIIERHYEKVVKGFPEAKKGKLYTMFLPNDILVYTPDFETEREYSDEGIEQWRNAGQNYTLTTFRPKGGMVQAMRVGYKLDMETQGRTYVNPFHAAKPYFEKTLKAVSEMDLTMALHAFPQKVQRVEACTGVTKGDDHEPCLNGVNRNGLTCDNCKGSGYEPIHTTAQDVIYAPMPKKGEQGYPNLEDYLKYFSPDVSLLEFQHKYVKELKEEAIRAVFTSDILTRTSIATTATEQTNNKEEFYNTLQPFAEHFSAVWRRIVRLIAAFTDNGKDLQLIHEFPSDFKLKTVAELYADLKLAKDSGASAFVIQQIEDDIASKLYVDDKNAYLKFKVKSRFTPFLGKTSDEIKWMIETNRVRKQDEILWTYSDTIFDELENEVPGFFLFTYDKQWKEIKRKVEEIMQGLPKDTTVIPFRREVNEETEPKTITVSA